MGLNIKTVIIILTILFIASCSDKEKSYYENGNIKSTFKLNSNGKKDGEEKIFYPTGELMSLTYFKNGKWTDSIVKFNKDGTYQSIIKRSNDSIFCQNYNQNILISKGAIDNKHRPIGWWYSYDNKKIYLKDENIIVENKSIINRQKIFKNGKLNIKESRFYNLIKPDNINKNEQYFFQIPFEFNEINPSENLLNKDYYYLFISPKINDDFSNIAHIKFDTIVPKRNKEFEFSYGFRNSGNKKIKGIIEKHTLIKENNKIVIKKSRMFIDETINVH